jgi:hypothetical protein
LKNLISSGRTLPVMPMMFTFKPSSRIDFVAVGPSMIGIFGVEGKRKGKKRQKILG